MTVLVLAEHDGVGLASATLNTVAAAGKIGGDIHLLVAGQGVAAVAQAAAQIAVDGLVKRLWQWSAPEPRHLEQLAALGFADRVPALARSAIDRVNRARTRLAEEIAERQEQDADLAVKAAAYLTLLSAP